jgi:Fic family protein
VEFEDDINALYDTYLSVLPMSEEDDARLWKKFRLDWNYNSNRIEGNTLTYGETEALFVLGTEPQRLQKDIREMKAHDVAISFVLKLADSDKLITEADIRDLNKITLKENYFIETETADGIITRKEVVPGDYKKTPNHVRLRGGGIHKFAEPHEVSARMESTVKSIRAFLKGKKTDLPHFLATLHQDFIQTHPFDDGNGRVVRMLLNYVCLKSNWPPVIIKDANKNDYLAALEAADKGDMSPLIDLVKSELSWSLKKAISAAKGEDIDDPEDLDKRLDLFAKLQEPKVDAYLLSRDTAQINARNCLKEILTLIDKKMNKLSNLFDEYRTYPNSFPLEKMPLENIKLYDNRGDITHSFNLRDWRAHDNNHDVTLSITGVALRDVYTIQAEVKSWLASKSGTKSSLFSKGEKTYTFPEHQFVSDTYINKIEPFVNSLMEEVLSCCESFTP